MNLEAAIDPSPPTQVVMPWEAWAVTIWDPLAYVLSPEDNQDLENVAKVLEEEYRWAQEREAVKRSEEETAKGVRVVDRAASQMQSDPQMLQIDPQMLQTLLDRLLEMSSTENKDRDQRDRESTKATETETEDKDRDQQGNKNSDEVEGKELWRMGVGAVCGTLLLLASLFIWLWRWRCSWLGKKPNIPPLS